MGVSVSGQGRSEGCIGAGEGTPGQREGPQMTVPTTTLRVEGRAPRSRAGLLAALGTADAEAAHASPRGP